jgi:O-antigen/teichoic acid export membrane protein
MTRRSISYSLVKKVNFKYLATCKNYIIYQAPAAVINTLTQNVFIFIVVYLYGVSVGGFFALANRLLLAPSALIGKSVREVFIREANKVKIDKLKIKNLYLKTLIKLFIIAIPAYLSAALLSYLFFPSIFGDEWLEVSYIFPILCIWGVFLFCNAPATALVYILELQKFSLVYEISSIILRLMGALIAHLAFNNYLVSILSFSIISALSNGFYIYYVYKKI